MRHKHADLIHAWAEGAEIQMSASTNDPDFGWIKVEGTPNWDWEGLNYRIKPKEPNWWENIPEHGVLVEGVHTGYVTKLKFMPSNPQDYRPLTNDEIERFKR